MLKALSRFLLFTAAAFLELVLERRLARLCFLETNRHGLPQKHRQTKKTSEIWYDRTVLALKLILPPERLLFNFLITKKPVVCVIWNEPFRAVYGRINGSTYNLRGCLDGGRKILEGGPTVHGVFMQECRSVWCRNI